MVDLRRETGYEGISHARKFLKAGSYDIRVFGNGNYFYESKELTIKVGQSKASCNHKMQRSQSFLLSGACST